MKSIFMQDVYKTEFYLGTPSNDCYSIYFGKSDVKLDVCDRRGDEGRVSEETKFLDQQKLFETDKIRRELQVNEEVKINEDTYTIKKVVHDVNGDLIYTVNEAVGVDDDESKEKAEEDLALRKVFLKGKEIGIELGIEMATQGGKFSREYQCDFIGKQPKPKNKWFKH